MRYGARLLTLCGMLVACAPTVTPQSFRMAEAWHVAHAGDRAQHPEAWSAYEVAFARAHQALKEEAIAQVELLTEHALAARALAEAQVAGEGLSRERERLERDVRDAAAELSADEDALHEAEQAVAMMEVEVRVLEARRAPLPTLKPATSPVRRKAQLALAQTYEREAEKVCGLTKVLRGEPVTARAASKPRDPGERLVAARSQVDTCLRELRAAVGGPLHAPPAPSGFESRPWGWEMALSPKAMSNVALPAVYPPSPNAAPSLAGCVAMIWVGSTKLEAAARPWAERARALGCDRVEVVVGEGPRASASLSITNAAWFAAPRQPKVAPAERNP